jgi:hypothetical protein
LVYVPETPCRNDESNLLLIAIYIGDEIFDGFEIAFFQNAGIMITPGQGFPDFSGALADLEEAAHM